MECRLRWGLLVLMAATVVQGRVKQVDITGLVGDSIRLPCEIDEEKCGEVHNIQWYRGDGDTRVFVYSELAKVDTSENMLQDRGYFQYTKGSSLTELEIRNLKADDESLYKCELTYLEVRDNCAVIQFVNLTTIAKPSSIRILLEDGTEAGAMIGPFEEDAQLYLKCESAGGKPAASVTWWNDTINMGGDVGAILSEDGTGVGMNELRVPLTRHDLGSVFECRASNEAVEYPLSTKVTLDLNVRPRTIELSGLESPVDEGSQVTLTCKVTGARPAANITWLRGTDRLLEQTSDSERVQPDSTTETISRYTFTATRDVNGDDIVCVATNAVIERKNESPLRAPVKVQVLYAPQVSVEPTNITVNESMDILLFCEIDANPTNLSSVIWYKDGRALDLTDEEKFEGGALDNPSLLIKNTSRRDAGRYRCEVANDVGVGRADNEAVVHVQFPPDTVITMEPAMVLERDRENVTFVCDVTDGNPDELLAVRWYLDGIMLRQVPDENCTNTTEINGTVTTLPYDIQDYYDPDSSEVLQLEELCGTNPAPLVLLSVERSFMANYSCSGKNAAGWGPRSKERELVVRYPPRQTALVYSPPTVLKGSAVTLTCEVDDPGYPPANKYMWMRGNHLISDVQESQWRINTVKLEDATTFSCTASNEAGNSLEGKVDLKVYTKPQFIERLPLYLGALMNSSSISVTCRVECSPLCSLQWLKDDEIIEEDSPLYSIKTSTLDPDPRTNDLESVVSTLTWNMSAWPGQMLDRVKDNANYTCRSTANPVGPGVSSTTFFTVEYPPENISLSSPIVDVVEGETPDEVVCQANAYPDANYIWKKDDAALQTGDRLRLNFQDGIKRDKAGEYECEAQNKHGVASTKVFVNVMYKPQCAIRQTEEDGEYLLLCEVDAVPDDVTFGWFFNNQTLKGDIHTEGTVSTLIVRPGSRDFGTYSCHVNNTVGAGVPCEIDVKGVSGWGMHLGSMNFIIIIVVVAVALVLLLVVCIIVILWCRRKKTKDKLGDPSKDKSSPNGAGGPDDRAVYENLPFHGMQQPPSKPLGPWSDMEYADVDYKSYGPIDYKHESQRVLAEKRSLQEAAQRGAPARPPKVSSV
ncbi:hemicentin-2-like isoform X2 [Amphibalanus amphitrite]|uniref:hemicentin-2-like isoform X2 n=1 Tax=Amphibalanus amphitrite TaxID=1232801 RepID=UPI001C92B167|nr:hemicentin-2-like isoform X2 [Amphibalanus amphitrite]